MKLTKNEERQKALLLQFRAKIENDIEYLNKELIYSDKDRIGGTCEVARDVRDKLIECSNLINTYRLVNRGREDL